MKTTHPIKEMNEKIKVIQKENKKSIGILYSFTLFGC
jgi:hypothetical protein